MIRLARWLRDHEPVWLVATAAAVVDVLTHVLPVVPVGWWHPGVDIALAVLTVLAQRRLAWSWATVVATVAATVAAHEPPGDAGQVVTPRLALTGGGHVQVIHYPADPPTLTTRGDPPR